MAEKNWGGYFKSISVKNFNFNKFILFQNFSKLQERDKLLNKNYSLQGVLFVFFLGGPGAVSLCSSLFDPKTRNLSLYSPYYVEACNEFAVPNFASLRQGNTATCVDLKRWRTVCNAV